MSDARSGAREVFGKAMEIESAADRAAYLDQACSGNQKLRADVEDLLKAHFDAGSFLEEPAQALALTIGLPPIAEGPGTTIGRYKLLQQIGEGGFGIVYMADQREPVRRKVALKIIKPGMDSREVIARFEAEEQALALMDHPHVARVLDAGATETGRPYFVMELVKGVPLTEYCDKNELGTHDRLQLFAQVCRTVHYAHQKGIIHRDIKPSNVLVTLHDGKPVPKIIDFGVAKAINQQLTEKTLFTSYGRMVGTPQYMSPEQAEMSGLDIDTRSDIYSLGVVLYELLTGTTPLEAERLRKAGYAEMQRMIREEEPPRPSVRLSTLGARLTIVAKHRSVDPNRLRQQVRGELDWIVMKSLEKDRGRRYDSAAGLAADVERLLGGEAVEACPPSTVYRMRKTLRRHRGLAAAVTAVLAVLLLGIAGTTAGMIRANIKAKGEQIARRQLEEQSYRDRINLAYQAWNERNRVQLERLLVGLLPAAGDDRPPPFELRYLWARFQEMCDPGNVREFPAPTTVTSVAYSGDGRYLAIGCIDRTVLL